MRTIIVKESEYQLIEDYINASLLYNRLTWCHTYDKKAENYNDVVNSCIDVINYIDGTLKKRLADIQYQIFVEADEEAEENEDRTLIDMSVFKKYIDIQIR